MLARMWSSSNSHSWLGGMQNTATLGESLVVSLKTKHALITRSSNHAPGIYSKELKTYPHQNVHVDVYGSCIHNCPNLEATKMPSLGKWRNCGTSRQRNSIHAKKKWPIEETQTHMTKWKKPTWKGYIVYDSNYETFWKRPNYGDGERISGCQGLRRI